jgi:predicted nucleic-acid-binding protein
MYVSGMRAIDTNVLVQLIVRDDPEQARSAEAFVTSGAWVSHLVLAETMWVLDAVYERSAAQIASALDLLLNHKNLSLQDADVVGSALEQFKRRPALGFSDCLNLEIARKAGHLPLGTFDKDLARLDGAQRLR